MDDLFTRCALKLARAVEHLKGIDQAAQAFVEEHGKPGILCTTGANAQGTRCLATVEEVPPYPEVEWGIMIGDAVHCLRSALDQMIATLCTEAATRRTGFPICKTRREWVVEAPGQIWSLPQKYVAIVDSAQPYHRGNEAHLHPLAILNELWNLDKHQAIPAVALVPNRVEISVNEEKTHGIASWTKFRTHPGRPLKKGTVLADCGFTLDPTATEPQMYVDAHIACDVGFGTLARAASISHKPVTKTFKRTLIPAVLDILKEAFAAHLSDSVGES